MADDVLVDKALTVMLARVEDGTAELDTVRRLSEQIKRAGFAPTENLPEHLKWQTKQWWANEQTTELRIAVSNLLESWSRTWPRAKGFLAYRAEAIREALTAPQRVPLSDAAQDFIQAESIEIAPRMTPRWITETVGHLEATLTQSRALLVEASLRSALLEKDTATTFPDELLQAILTVNTDETDRAFAIWLEAFAPEGQEVWKALLAMERERWKDVTEGVDTYVGRLPQTKATAFVRQIAVSEEEDVAVLLREIDPANTVQKRLAAAQQKFLADATNSERRREALKRIGALELTTKEAQAQLVEQIFQTASQSDSAANDVFRAFPKHLRDAPGVMGRYKSLKKEVAPTVWDRAERFRKKFLRF